MTTTTMPFLLLELPPDAFLHVLCRFPLKYLMRLRCVSKFFLDLTNDPNFIFYYRLHCKKTNPPPPNDDDDDDEFPPPSPPPNLLLDDDFNFMDTTTTTTSSSSEWQWQRQWEWVPPWRFHVLFKGSNFIYLQKRDELIPFHCPNHKRLIGSINGLICFGGPCSLEIYNILAGTNFNLIHPLGCNNAIFAFGYDPISNDYKTLCVDSFSLYSFRTNSWKQLNFKSCGYHTGDSIIERGGGVSSVCINGIIYWPPAGNHHHHHHLDGIIYWQSGIHHYCDPDHNNNNKIVLFDLHKEKFSEIHLPGGEEEEDQDLLLPRSNMQLLSFRGCLAFAFINKRRGGTKTKSKSRKGGGGGGEIWVELFKLKTSCNASLEDQEEEKNYSWIRKTFVVPNLSTHQKEVAEIVSCCDEIFLGWVESKQLRLYNLHTKEFFNLPLSPPSHHYPKVSLGKKINDPTYVDNLRFDFSLI